jgi:GT2 family glycosyltransferase
MNSCSIIVPMFNQAALTRQCLAALQGVRAEIVVVDDASTEAFADPAVHVIRHDNNTGFATACNDGAAATRGEWLIFLNNDTIPQRGWLDALVNYAAQHPHAAVIGSKLLYPSGTIQHAGVVICEDRYPRHIYAGFPADHPAVNKSRRYQIVTAACALVRRSAFEQAGGFDAAYRNGFEDVDLCLRLGELGHEMHYCHESVVTHLESVSPSRFKHDRDNVALYRQRWLERVRPDDMQYYCADGLLTFQYEGTYPAHLQVSPLLAVTDCAAQQALIDRTRQVAELTRENTRLRMQLGGDSPALQSEALRQQVRSAIQRTAPMGATVLVISKGDGALLDLPDRHGAHFPQTERGAYAGHHPADSAAAIDHLTELRARGAGFLMIPQPSFWWLDHYADFATHLNSVGQRVWADEACVIYRLTT